MIDEPISNPPSQPTPAVQPPSEERPGLGPELAEEPKPFSLPPEAPKAQPTGVEPGASEKPTPMDVARDTARGQGWSSQEIQDNMQRLQSQLATAQKQLSDPNVTGKFSPDHFTALTRLTDKMTPDMRAIAKYTQGEFTPPPPGKGESVLHQVLKWVGSSQDMMEGALSFAGTVKNPNPSDMLRLQFAMHRATERGELFSSIISSTVSGIKTIMSAQLG